MKSGPALAAIVALSCSHASAEDDPTSTTAGRNSFTASDFSRFAPSTALDMVEQVPGFRIAETDDDEKRGFGQADGNVLINGERLSGKSTSAEDVLARIPAANVERIELLDGASLNIPGLSGQVVNVTAKVSALSGAWTWEGGVRKRFAPRWLAGELSLTGGDERLSWTLSAAKNSRERGNFGQEIVTTALGDVIQTRKEAFVFDQQVPSISGAMTWRRPSGDVLNLNANLDYFEEDLREKTRNRPTTTLPASQRVFRRGEDSISSELGGDYETGLGKGRLKLIALRRDAHSPFTQSVADYNETGPANEALVRFEQIVDTSETIARAEYSISVRDGHDWQVAGEAALNTLDATSALFGLGPGGALEPLPIGSPRAEVEERRIDLALTHGRRLTSGLTVQASLGGEVSEIEAGDGRSDSFSRPKGFVAASYVIQDGYTVNARLAREVGQLDFFDFVSSVDLGQDTADRGNSGIVPQQSWLGEMTVERTFGDFGAGTLRLYGEDIEDIVDRVPLANGSEGPGNIDSARRWGGELTGTLKLDPFGLTGAQILLEAEANSSRLDDPLTGETRRISGDLVSEVIVEARRDFPGTPWAVLLGYEQNREARDYRINETSFRPRIAGRSYVMVEHKDLWGMTGSIRVDNLTDQRDQSTRTVFAPDRTGSISFIESRDRGYNPIVSLTLSGTF